MEKLGPLALVLLAAVAQCHQPSRIESLDPHYRGCLDRSSAAAVNTPLQLWNCDDYADAQRWLYNHTSGTI